jgi:hypothetical protein
LALALALIVSDLEIPWRYTVSPRQRRKRLHVKVVVYAYHHLEGYYRALASAVSDRLLLAVDCYLPDQLKHHLHKHSFSIAVGAARVRINANAATRVMLTLLPIHRLDTYTHL